VTSRRIAAALVLVFVPMMALVVTFLALVADVERDRRFVLMLLFGTVLSGLAAFVTFRAVLQRGVVHHLETLTARAESVATGPTTLAPLAATGTPELDRLVDAINALISRLQTSADSLVANREAFSRAITGVGDVLASTHDRRAILEVVVEMATLTTRARQGALWVARGSGLLARYQFGGEVAGDPLARGSGIAGWVAEHDRPATTADGHRPVAPEPPGPVALAVPLHSRDRVFGVLAVYGRADDHEHPFTGDDLSALRALAGQAEAAVENTFLVEETRRLAITDGLTGVWNRRQFDLRLADEVTRASRFDEPFAMLLIDVDDFKVVNDTMGHLVGDHVLVEITRRLKSATRRVDVVARFGGEEFALLLPRTDLDGAHLLAEKIRAAVAAEPIATEAGPATLTVSIGVAGYPVSAGDATALVGAADHAVYGAKAAGKNRVELAPPRCPDREAP
jgi:diguanylate cyclase (GGDEF)-like protein